MAQTSSFLWRIAVITKEQARYLLSPAFAETTSWGQFEIIEDPIPNGTYVLDEYPSVQFDNEWTEEDEECMWNNWRVIDEMSLRTMTPGEFAVWRRSRQLYDMAPTDIFTGPLFFKGLGAVKVTWEGQKYEIENQNWGQEFSNLMVKVMTCTAFCDNLSFLRYVLQYVLHYRVGETSCPKPSLSSLDEDKDWVAYINTTAPKVGIELQVPSTYQEPIDAALRIKSRTLKNPHVKLIDELKRQVVPDMDPKTGKTKKKRTPQGLSNKDLQNIIDAWDNRYIIWQDQLGRWKTIKEYVQGYEARSNPDRGKLRQGEQDRASIVLDARRLWIMNARGTNTLRVSFATVPKHQLRTLRSLRSRRNEDEDEDFNGNVNGFEGRIFSEEEESDGHDNDRFGGAIFTDEEESLEHDDAREELNVVDDGIPINNANNDKISLQQFNTPRASSPGDKILEPEIAEAPMNTRDHGFSTLRGDRGSHDSTGPSASVHSPPAVDIMDGLLTLLESQAP
ncbi:hypothetical protein VTL71DRAFT_6491 [Oculimacula yallundae]|uniref:Uncharacterized protein n=1 Tax=Oculimacula yallundae TaxID=86028 RepID=A0ABR4BX42_9HELO